jgi:hypothetical protein
LRRRARTKILSAPVARVRRRVGVTTLIPLPLPKGADIMPRFAKRPDCPASATLQAYGANARSFLARPGVAAHLAACEFCGAELSLLAQPAPAFEKPESEPLPPPMPLALRLFARSALADMADAARSEARRAA